MSETLAEWTEAERMEAIRLYQRWQAAGCRVSFPKAVLHALRSAVMGAEAYRTAVAEMERIAAPVTRCPGCGCREVCWCEEGER